jgi:hypothetical protein
MCADRQGGQKYEDARAVNFGNDAATFAAIGLMWFANSPSMVTEELDSPPPFKRLVRAQLKNLVSGRATPTTGP